MCLHTESKKTKSSGRPTKSKVQDSYPDSVFVQFLKESGVTLTAGSTANEIGKIQNEKVCIVYNKCEINSYQLFFFFLLQL